MKLLLCISSLSSIKDKHLTKVSFLEAQTQNVYFSSVDYFLSLENNQNNNNDNQNNIFDINNFDNLNLSESLVNDIKNIKNAIPEKKEGGEGDKLKLPFGINNDINLDDNPFDNNIQSQYFGKISDMHKLKNENKEKNNLNNLETLKEKLINNNNNLEPIKVEKKMYINPSNDLSDIGKNPFEDMNNKNNTYNQNISSDQQTAVFVEKKTYCNIVKIGQDGGVINNDTKTANFTNTNNNTTNNTSNISQGNEISFFLSGGDFLKKKIEILDETIIKNSEMYNYVIDKYEKDLKILKEELENLKIKHKEEIDKLTKERDDYLNQVNDLSTLKNDNQNEIEKIKNENNLNSNLIEQKDNEIFDLKKNIDEVNRQLNKKDIENIELNKNIEELKKQKEKEMLDFQKQIKDITFLKDQEISMLNDKIKSEQNNSNDKSLLLEQNFENYKINSNKIQNELMEQNNLLKKQVNEIPFLRDEIEKYKKLYENIDNENAKLHSESIDFQDRLEMGGKLNMELKQKIEILEKKLKSDPYFAREIMSRTLYNFALNLMTEKN